MKAGRRAARRVPPPSTRCIACGVPHPFNTCHGCHQPHPPPDCALPGQALDRPLATVRVIRHLRRDRGSIVAHEHAADVPCVQCAAERAS